MKTRLIVWLAGLCLLAKPMAVRADDTEDLFNIYGMTLGKPVRSDIQRDIESMEEDLSSMQVQKEINKEYNAMVEEYRKKRETTVNNITAGVSSYQTINQSIASDISSNLLTMDIEELVSKDKSYKDNIVSMNSLLSTLDGYLIDNFYEQDDIDLSVLESRIADAKQVYLELLDTFNLGDVKDIKWILPNERHINSEFGYRVDPLVTNEIRYHSGTDYRASTGTPIGALFNGVVISAGWSDTIGNFVTVQCGDNVKYLVCHCSSLNVEVGQEVHQYDIIAYSGGTGSRCTGPHLHLALYLNGVAFNVDELYN